MYKYMYVMTVLLPKVLIFLQNWEIKEVYFEILVCAAIYYLF